MSVIEKKTKNIFESENFSKRIILIALCVQIAAFVYYQISKALNIDECMLVLNARNIADNMTDVLGQRMPSYFNTWIIGGQAALPTYLVALIIKIFGHHLVMERLLMLLLSFASLFAGVYLIKDIFKNRVLANIAITLFAFQPWRILQSCWLLDCAFFPHFFIIGAYFLNKAANRGKSIGFYALSMFFFALGSYSYQPAMIGVSVFLAVYYIIMMLKKKIIFGYAVFFALTYTVLVIPVILSLLTLSNTIDSFNFLGFTFVSGEHFNRQNTLIFFNSDFGNDLLKNIKGVFETLLFPDLMFILGFGTSGCKVSLSILSYGHILGAIGTATGILTCAFYALKKRKVIFDGHYISAVSLISGCLMSYAVFSLLVEYNMTCGHRYTVYYFMMNLISAIGWYFIIKYFKVKMAKPILVILLTFSLVLTSYSVYGFANTKTLSLSADGFESICDKYFENPSELVFIGQDFRDYTRFSTYIRYRFYEEADEFEPYYDEMMYEYRYTDKKPKTDARERFLIKSDGSIKFEYISDGFILDADNYIIFDENFSQSMSALDLSNYEIYNDGCFYLLTKKGC